MITIPSSNYHTVKTDLLEACSLHYLTLGDPEKPVVFCAHALTCIAHDFDYLANALAEDFYVISVDMPGRGHSSNLNNPEQYDNATYLHYCFALLEHLGIERVHWVGSSMGGMMGMLACMMKQELIQSLMLNDVGKILAREGLEDIFLYIKGRKDATTDRAAFEAQIRENYKACNFTNEDHWQHFFNHRVKQNANGEYQLRYDPAIMASFRAQAETMDKIDDVSLEPLWDTVACPTLIFRGAESLLFRESTALSMRDDDGKDVTLHQWEGVGHMPNLMEKEQTDIVREWLLMQR